MKILITGGAGMIGSSLVRRLVDQGHKVFVADNFWRGKREYLIDTGGDFVIPEENLFQVDLRAYEACLQVTKDMDAVYHLADIVAGINFVFANQLFLWHANVLINTNVLNACVENKVKSYVYVGTACSYPKDKQSYLNPPPFKEDDVYPAEPESAYGWSKLMGEYEAELAAQEGLLDVGILRLHNVYGPPCELDPEKSQVIPALCRKAIMHSTEPFVVWGSGNQRRAFVYVDDVVDALVLVLERGMNQGVIQIGPSESISISEIANKVVALSGKDIEIEYDTNRPEGDMDRTADWSKAKEILGWEPRIQIDEGLQKTYEWCDASLVM
ncbi:MAG: NAD-dependent epimerase/dehydratase family protein [Candidatus Marinimicrobia bacterium]|jgi:GDP-D-mannose 3', 5'-epimerase|nr:NAD-dependent epimerase/dehydratase family protein [Candidatus Neomarinimicrobiota bacterium]